MSQRIVPAIRFPKLKPEHAGKWVAMSSQTGKFIAVGETLSETRKKAANYKDKKTIFVVLPHMYAGTTV